MGGHVLCYCGGVFVAYLVVDMGAGAIISLRPLDTDTILCHLGAPDAAVSGPYHINGGHNTEIPAFTRVGFPALGGETDVQALHHGISLVSAKAVD